MISSNIGIADLTSSGPTAPATPASTPALPAAPAATEAAAADAFVIYCSGCRCVISDRYLLKVARRENECQSQGRGQHQDQCKGEGQREVVDAGYWHEDCLRCSYCACALIRTSPTLYVKDGLNLCRQDYFRLYGRTSRCCGCFNTISPLELVMRVGTECYHNDCFICHTCKKRFHKGDYCYSRDGHIFCEDDRPTYTSFHPIKSSSVLHRTEKFAAINDSISWNNLAQNRTCWNNSETISYTTETMQPGKAERPDSMENILGDDGASSGYDSPDLDLTSGHH